MGIRRGGGGILCVQNLENRVDENPPLCHVPGVGLPVRCTCRRDERHGGCHARKDSRRGGGTRRIIGELHLLHLVRSVPHSQPTGVPQKIPWIPAGDRREEKEPEGQSQQARRGGTPQTRRTPCHRLGRGREALRWTSLHLHARGRHLDSPGQRPCVRHAPGFRSIFSDSRCSGGHPAHGRANPRRGSRGPAGQVSWQNRGGAGACQAEPQPQSPLPHPKRTPFKERRSRRRSGKTSEEAPNLPDRSSPSSRAYSDSSKSSSRSSTSYVFLRIFP